MTRNSLCQYRCVHASTSLLRFACFCLRSSHARTSHSSARVVRNLLVHLSYNVCTAPLHANTTQSMPTQLCMQHLQTRRSAQSALSRSAAFSSFYSNSELIEKPMTRDSLCQYSCVHASTSLHKFACFWLRSSHARSSESSARVVRTLLVRLLCNVGTAPALANTTGSMPTQLCMRQLQMRWSAQSALSRSAASDCFLHAFLPAGEANNTWQPLPIQLHACEHKMLKFACFSLRLSHARSSHSSARVVRTLLVNLCCNVCTAPLDANTTRSMPTQLCMRELRTLWSAQSALSTSAALNCFYSDPKLLGKWMTRNSLCQYRCVHASTSLLRFACFCLRSSHVRTSHSSARVVRNLLVHLSYNVCTAPLHANTTQSMPTQLCMRQLQMRWSAQSALSRSAASDCFLHAFLPAGEANNTWQHLPIQLHACEHKMLKFACFSLRLSHARSSHSSARVVRTLLVNLCCNVCTAPLDANTTRSMPTQLCMRELRTLWSAQSALSTSAALNCFYSDPKLLGKRMTRNSLCQYRCVHASTSLLRFACFCLRSSHARTSHSSARVVRNLLVHLSFNVCTAPLHANTTQSMPTQLCMQHLQTRRSAQSALSRSAAFSSFYSNSELIEKPMTRDSLCQYSCVHASTSLHKFACFWLCSSHARSSESSARVVRTLLVRLLCNVGTAPALANTTGSMPTQLCMRQLQMRWSAQSALSRSAASDCFLHAFLPAGEANNTWQPLPIQLHACEHQKVQVCLFFPALVACQIITFISSGCAHFTRQPVLQRLHGAVRCQYNSIYANTALHAGTSNAVVSSVRPQHISRFELLLLGSQAAWEADDTK